MIIFAGLGNPGSEHARNRHNIGFMAVDEIARRHDFSPWRRRSRRETSEGRLGTRKVLLLKPQTYMNESGRSVGEVAHFYKVPSRDIYVFHDELDLAAGKLRCKLGGGVAGHNGLKSIASQIGKDFQRVRMGIGHPGSREKVLSHVLKDFSRDDQDWLERMLDGVAENAVLLAEGSTGSFQNKVYLAINPEPPKKKRSEPSPGDGDVSSDRRRAEREGEDARGPMAAALKKFFGG